MPGPMLAAALATCVRFAALYPLPMPSARNVPGTS